MTTILAQLDPDGVPVTVPRGVAFTAYRKLVEDEHDVAISLGAPIGTPVAFEVSVGWQTLDVWGPADLARHCIQAVELADPPALQQLASYDLVVDQAGAIAAENVVFEPVPVPAEVSAMQAQLVLEAQGELADVETAISGASKSVQIYWAKAVTLHRAHPVLAEMAAALGWSDAKVDDLFRAAQVQS